MKNKSNLSTNKCVKEVAGRKGVGKHSQELDVHVWAFVKKVFPDGMHGLELVCREVIKMAREVEHVHGGVVRLRNKIKYLKCMRRDEIGKEHLLTP